MRSTCILELTQETVLVNALLQKILTSRRLLSDHVETLELSSINIKSDGTNRQLFLVAPTVGLLGITVVSAQYLDQSWLTLKILSAVAFGGYGICWAIKSINSINNKLICKRLDAILEVLNGMDSAIRRTIVYLRETKVLQPNDISTINIDVIARNCIESVIEITKLLFEVTKNLEKTVLPPKVASIYQPLDDIEGCAYFERDIEEFAANDVKDFYNVFLYFQSQLLTRLCLSFAFNRAVGIGFLKTNASKIHTVFERNLKVILEPLCVENDKSNKKNRTKTELLLKSGHSVPLNNVKTESLEITSRLAAVATECSQMDGAIQTITDKMILNQTNPKELENIFNTARLIEQSLGVCLGDVQRLVLSCNKILLISSQILPIEELKTDAGHESHIENNNVKVQFAEDTLEDNSDYFAFRYPDDDETTSDEADSQEETESYDLNDEIEIIDRKIVKKRFAPVLQQLKEKIHPINDAMKERERKYLTSMGMDLHILDADDLNSALAQDRNDTDDSDDSEMEARIKSRSKYDEMRSFLEEKQQINFLPNLPLPQINLGDEDILE